MRSLLDSIILSHDVVKARESIEWANFWYSQSNGSPSVGRVLMVGDSTVRMVRSTFERYIGSPVDMIGTSCGLHDILFIRQVEAFFASTCYRYSAIFVQLGHHSIINDQGSFYEDVDYERYRDDLVGLISYLRQYSQNIILLSCFLNVVPLPKLLNKRFLNIPILLYRKVFGEKIDYTWSNIVIKKNEIISCVAEKEGLRFCDINGIMLEKCKAPFPKFIHYDHIHYENKAKKFIVYEYAKYI